MKISFVIPVLLLCALPSQARTYIVDNANPRASDTASGDAATPLRSINAAAQKAQAGDEIVVNAGVYRETIVPARGGEQGKPIIYRAAKMGQVVVKASEVWTPQWEKVEGQTSVFRAALPTETLQSFNPFARKIKSFDGLLSRGQIFHRGQLLRELTDTQNFDGTLAWRAVEQGTAIEIHAPDGAPPEVEISTRAALFRPDLRGLGYITLRDFVFEGGANDLVTAFWKDGQNPQAGTVSTRSGHHWVLENNVIRFAKTVGLDCGSEGLGRPIDGQPAPDSVGYHLVRGNWVSDNGQAGIFGSRQIGSRFERNVIARNNTLHFDNYEEAGMKCHGFLNCVVEGNLFLDNESDGLWIDNVWQNTRVTHNAFIGNRTAGMFLEMGRGPFVVEKNVFGWSRPGFNPKNPRGDGFYAHDASEFTVRNNIMVDNANFGVYLRTVTDRQFNYFPLDVDSLKTKAVRRETVSTADIVVENNLIAGNGGVTNLRLDDATGENSVNHNWLGAPLQFQVSVFRETPTKVAKELVDKPLSLQQWYDLTGQDKASELIQARSWATLIAGERPRILVEMEKQPDGDWFAGMERDDLPYQLEIRYRDGK